jgi:hypothetical protein
VPSQRSRPRDGISRPSYWLLSRSVLPEPCRRDRSTPGRIGVAKWLGRLVVRFECRQGDPPCRGLHQRIPFLDFLRNPLRDAMLINGQLGKTVGLSITIEVKLRQIASISKSRHPDVRLFLMRWHPHHRVPCSVVERRMHQSIDACMRAPVGSSPLTTSVNGLDARLTVHPVLAPRLRPRRRRGEGPRLGPWNIINPSRCHAWHGAGLRLNYKIRTKPLEKHLPGQVAKTSNENYFSYFQNYTLQPNRIYTSARYRQADWRILG